MTDDSNFSWNDKKDIVIPQVDAVAVYTNVNGEIVIRQRDSIGGDDSLIIIPKSHGMALVAAIRNELGSSAE